MSIAGGATGAVTVLGAGVVGLSAAVALAKSGRAVELVAAAEGAATTSYVAGAVWEPYLSGGDRVLDWAADTLGWLRKLSELPGSGVSLQQVRHVSRHPLTARPAWTDLVEVGPAGDLPDGFADGFAVDVPVVDMPRHLAWLCDRLTDYGGTVRRARVDSLRGLGTTVVNCTGLGARDLAGDESVRPVRGDVLWVRNPGLTGCLLELDEDDPTRPTYLMPHGDRLVLGGTARPDVEDLDPDPDTERDIRARCAALDPRVADAELLAHRVGLRPTRPTVRVAREQVGGVAVVHDYGHGGSGVTLAWGCAREVVRLLGGTVRA